MEKVINKDSLESSFNAIQSGWIYRAVIDYTEKVLIQKALERSEGNQITAAKLLGLNRNTIRTKIRRLNIDLEKYR